MQQLLLLHGALGAKDQFYPLADKLKGKFVVHTLNFTAHGGEAIPEAPLSIDTYAKDVLRYMDTQGIERANIFGYSMGGYVGMYIAKLFPQRLHQLITLACKFHWDEAIAAREVKMLDPAAIELKVPAFGQQLSKRHAPADWKLLLQKTTEMMLDLGKDKTLMPAGYATITTPSLIMLGDRDKMVTLEETVTVYKNLLNAQLCILPNTSHPLEQVNVDLLAYVIYTFLS